MKMRDLNINPVLKRRARTVQNIGVETKWLIRKMAKELFKHSALGIAAPQMGIPRKIFIIAEDTGKKRKKLKVFINPTITRMSPNMNVKGEGCISLPGVVKLVPRALSVCVRYQDLSGNWKEEDFHGTSARCIQHEIDHLYGILITDIRRKSNGIC